MKKIFVIFLACILLLNACGKKEEENKEWTYELLEEEFGGIIDADFDSVKKCINLITNHEFIVYGYVTEMEGLGLITLSDDMENPKDYNSVNVRITSDDSSKVNVGDLVYACGRIYYTPERISLGCFTDGYLSLEPIDGSISVRDYVKTIEKIYNDTYFRTEGLVMQDGTNSAGTPRYLLYASEESYGESKYNYIKLVFLEEQHNINGRTVVIMGKLGDSLIIGELIECSIIEER